MPKPIDNLAEADERPWEEPGSCRMDCEPHRANLLMLLATISLTCGLLALCVGVPGVIGFPLGLVTTWMARRDLAAMTAGHMDPSGEGEVKRAEVKGATGAGLSLLALVCF